MTPERTPSKVFQSLVHDSATLHVTGEALYIDDIPEPPGTLQVYIATSPHARARITRMNLEQVKSALGVEMVLTVADLPPFEDGQPEHDTSFFADGEVHCQGHLLFAVAAHTIEEAYAAANLAQIEYEPLDAILTIDEALKKDSYLSPSKRMHCGDSQTALDAAPERLSGCVSTGGQDHFYLEGQISLAIPGEGKDILLYSSTQHPTAIQAVVAHALGRPVSAVTVEVRRIGGGFGGKEFQSAPFAVVAALVADRTRRPAKVRLDRDDDMIMTGKRHDYQVQYDVGFDHEGQILGIEIEMASRCGITLDSSDAVNDRSMRHVDNAYYLPNVSIISHRCRTNTVSNTAFRGFGVPQAMITIERVMEEIAFQLGKDPLDIRLKNLYGGVGRDMTPYQQRVEDNILPQLIDQLEKESKYRERHDAIRKFNVTSSVLKKGIALTPVKLGIGFTTIHMNQGGALVHVYADGSIHLNHGGTEMGQGLFIKVAQVVAEEFQVDVERIKISATNTDKVPNTSCTAASASSDINGAAARNAARTIRQRLCRFASEKFNVAEDEILFSENRVQIGNATEIAFEDLVKQAYEGRVSLSSTGFYSTPKIHFDTTLQQGHPYYYFAYGAAVSEVIIDTYTGENSVTRVDILHDVGRSLNPAIDLGQIEGGFMQGLGMMTTEELWWNSQGCLLTHAPSTYKIPACGDRPAEFNIRLLEGVMNREKTIFRSKGVGEPPVMLAISVLHALSDAVASVADYQFCPQLDTPATPERILSAVEKLRVQRKSKIGAITSQTSTTPQREPA